MPPFDLGTIAFFVFVLAQLLAVIALRNFESDARNKQSRRPVSAAEPSDGDAPPLQPALMP